MSATEELRALLDERGVEWSTNETLTDCWTRWDADKFRCTATEINGVFAFTVGNSTSEQAIAATLGRGTCRLTLASWDDDECTWGCICSACDAHLEHETGIGYNFCPICGAKVVKHEQVRA